MCAHLVCAHMWCTYSYISDVCCGNVCFMHGIAAYHSNPAVSHEVLLQGQGEHHCTYGTNIYSSAQVYLVHRGS